jgi:hypothetical protein
MTTSTHQRTPGFLWVFYDNKKTEKDGFGRARVDVRDTQERNDDATWFFRQTRGREV